MHNSNRKDVFNYISLNYQSINNSSTINNNQIEAAYVSNNNSGPNNKKDSNLNGSKSIFSSNGKNSSNYKLKDMLKFRKINKEISRNKNTINIIFLGDKCTGKTSIVYQYMSNKFDQYYIQTIAREEFSKNIKFEGKTYKINLIVTSGVPQYQEDYSKLYETSDFFVVCFDQTLPKTFDKAKEIIKTEIVQYLFLMQENFANVILIANKADSKEKKVSMVEINKFCEKYKIQLFETSAKSKLNIQNAFNKIIEVYDKIIN